MATKKGTSTWLGIVAGAAGALVAYYYFARKTAEKSKVQEAASKSRAIIPVAPSAIPTPKAETTAAPASTAPIMPEPEILSPPVPPPIDSQDVFFSPVSNGSQQTQPSPASDSRFAGLHRRLGSMAELGMFDQIPPPMLGSFLEQELGLPEED